MSDRLLRVLDIVKEYPGPGAPVRALAGVSLELGAGESLAVMGPSGSGKSTLLNVIGTLDAPTSGRVLFDGKDVHALGAKAAARFRNASVGFVFQDHHLLPQCTALENVLLPSLAFGSAGSETVARAREILAAVRLAGKEDRFSAELSGGERQRVAIARAMVNAPRLLLCDEPTGDLDAETGEAVARLFLRLRDEKRVGLLVVTHNAAIASLFGRSRTLLDGRLV
jgi:lipoprotein-releasing system ATP-binding protein